MNDVLPRRAASRLRAQRSLPERSLPGRLLPGRPLQGRQRGGAALLLFALLLFLGGAAAGEAGAQTRGDGSIYSRFGVGELRRFSSPQAQALGGGGLALRSLNYTGFVNPALWSDQELTRLVLGARYRQVATEDGAGQTSRLSNGALQAVQFSFPLYTGKLGVGVGFRPYSRVEYRVQGDSLALPGAARGGTQYQTRYEGEGGLQEISGGVGYRLGDVLALGLRADIIFGILENRRRTSFSDLRFTPTTVSSRTRVAGVTGTAGALVSLASVLRDEDALSIGATVTLPARLSGERERTLGENLDRITLGEEGELETDGSLTVPLSAALGLSYKPSARWTVVADGRYEPWSGAESDFGSALPGLETLRDYARASAGVEFLPAGADRNETFLKRTAYRLGGYFEQSYVEAGTVFGNAPAPAVGADPSSAGVDVLAATGGLSLPTPLYGTRIDVGFEVGTRGTTDANLVRDLFYGFSLNVNLGERWFQRRKLR